MTADTYNLQRFVDAQASFYEAARRELAAGDKRSHWMWFVFPQLRGLGSSPTAQFYEIAGRAEAEAYLAHPVLGARLLECTRLVLAIDGRKLHQIFGSPDDLKFRSSMTLFAEVAQDPQPFNDALERCCGGQRDEATVRMLDPRLG